MFFAANGAQSKTKTESVVTKWSKVKTALAEVRRIKMDRQKLILVFQILQTENKRNLSSEQDVKVQS